MKGTGRTLLTTGIFITLLSVVGKVFCKILNNRLVQCLDKEGALHEGQAGWLALELTEVAWIMCTL